MAYSSEQRSHNVGDIQWKLPPPLTEREGNIPQKPGMNINFPSGVEQTVHQWTQMQMEKNISQKNDKPLGRYRKDSEPISKLQQNSYSLIDDRSAKSAPNPVNKAIQDIVESQSQENRGEVLSNLEKIVHGLKRSLSLQEKPEGIHSSRQDKYKSNSSKKSSSRGKTHRYDRKEKKGVSEKQKANRRASTPTAVHRAEKLETPVRGLTPIRPPDSETSSDDSYNKYDRRHKHYSTSSSSSLEERPSRSIRKHTTHPRMRTSSSLTSSRDSSGQDRDFIKRMVAVLKGAGVGSGCGVPEPEIFSVSKGTSFSQFLDHFEKYCRHQYSGHKNYWVKELEKFLDGDIKNVYLSVRKPRTTYKEIKEMLSEWYIDTRRHRISTKRIQFEQATRKHGEDLSVFAVRLESLAKEAYPRQDMTHSRELREKFLSAIPSKANKFIIAHNWQTKQATGHKLSWRQIKELVAMEFSTNTRKQDSEEDSDYEICPTEGMYRNVYVGENKLKDNKQKESAKVTSPDQTRKEEITEKCQLCNKLGHKQDDCRKKPGVCWECGGENHLARHCLQRLKKNEKNRQQKNKFFKDNRQYFGNQHTNLQWNPQSTNTQQRASQRWNNRQQQYYYPSWNPDQSNIQSQQQYWNQDQNQSYRQQQGNPSWMKNGNQQVN